MMRTRRRRQQRVTMQDLVEAEVYDVAQEAKEGDEQQQFDVGCFEAM